MYYVFSCALPMLEDDEPIEIVIPEPRKLPSAEEKAAARRRRMKIRLWFYGTVIALLYFVLWIQPYEIDLVARKPTGPNPMVDPDSKGLFAKGAKVLVVTAHPDDSEFFIGGLLAKLAKTGAELHQVICTDGDKGYYLFFTDAAKNRVVRRQEAQNAANAWHAQSLELLGYPDRFLHPNSDVVSRIQAEIERIRPAYILTFDGEYPPRASHQDHRRAGDATRMAAEKAKSTAWLMMFQTGAPNYVVDISDLWEDQKKLLQIHKSQFFGKHLDGVENMIEYSAEKDGGLIGVELGEGLRCVKLH
jgi:LmbE family N-acetylglucosaminyl deacetylase